MHILQSPSSRTYLDELTIRLVLYTDSVSMFKGQNPGLGSESDSDSHGSCSNSIGIGAVVHTFYKGKETKSLRLEILCLSTVVELELESESVSMLSLLKNLTHDWTRSPYLVSGQSQSLNQDQIIGKRLL